MHYFVTGLLALAALLWILAAIDMAIGIPSIPHIKKIAPLKDQECPSVSILFAARDEAEKLPEALEKLLAQDFPRYEVIAVNDRSEDGTRKILEAAAAKDPKLKPINLTALPEGWLGKPHALQRAFEESSGEWLVFTDADVHFAPDVLRRTLALALRERWDHLTLLARVEMQTVGEKITLTYLALALMMGVRAWHVSKPNSGTYLGVGAFQLIRREAYEKMGTHRRLAMEVVDDIKLGKLAKQTGIRSGVALSGDAVSVRWHAGVGNIVRGTTKNFFAAAGYEFWRACMQISGILVMCVVPFVALPFVRGWALAFACIACVLAVTAQVGVAYEFEESPLYGVTHPIGALLFAWMLARSTFVTLRQGGIVWRGTFYPLKDLKRGAA